jgi:hypothetical protein
VELKDYEPLVTKVARHLSGRDVTIRFRAPYIDCANGICMRVGAKAVIDVLPGRGIQAEVMTLLHECAHAYLDLDIMADESEHVNYAPASCVFASKSAEVQQKIINQPLEDRATNQVRQWLEYAEANYREYLKRDPVEARLQALLHWMDPAIVELVNQAVKTAIQTILNSRKG